MNNWDADVKALATHLTNDLEETTVNLVLIDILFILLQPIHIFHTKIVPGNIINTKFRSEILEMLELVISYLVVLINLT